MGPPIILLLLTLVASTLAKLDCDPTANVKKADPSSPESYLYCNLEGTFSKRKCVNGKVFNAEAGECELLHQSDDPEEDPLSKPFYQAPDDLCGGGIPLTILSAPVACNPSISSCPDGYVCRMYERTGTSYCCQGGNTPKSATTMCGDGQVTYIEPSTGKPRSCVLSSSSSCPTGFGCNLVAGTTTRCCAKDLGCPFNSAPLLQSQTASHVECDPSDSSACQRGFACMRSTTLGKNICCSSNRNDNGQCPNGDSPLARPSSCSGSEPCPTGYICTNGKCCPSAAVCPAGLPLGGGPTVCGDSNPCREGYQCITNAGVQYCCPTREKVCPLNRNAGVTCANSRPAVTRYYFDSATGSCRSFQFSQCGGNANNFNSLEECEGFCLDSQCTQGQAYRVGAVNAICSLSAVNTCPREHICQAPVFGPSPICCPTPELTCNEMVSAGTPCFGRSVTVQRYYFNPTTRKCAAFQYYGCNGNGNNFGSMGECADFCLNAVDSVCGGVAPLMDPNQLPQRCSAAVPCPAGYDCNGENYCCPSSQISCSAQMSRGNACSGTTQRTMWYYDSAQRKCKQFVYNGCGGTANRFSSLKACSMTCVSTSAVGQCPRGMSAYVEDGDIAPKKLVKHSTDATKRPVTCTLNVMGTCPSIASCVRSTTSQPICCQTVTSCPDNRTPYIIPGSNSVVACNVDADDCPQGNVCVESSTVPGFHMCCSNSISARPPSKSKKPDTLAALMKSMSPCPPNLQSNGQTCTVNAIGECPDNHICFRDVGYEVGSCCRTHPPKCAMKSFVPVFLERSQVQVCQIDLGGCPRDSRCMTSTIPKMSICCKKYSPPSQVVNSGSTSPNAPKCIDGSRPFFVGSTLQECNFAFNTCPEGYKCEFSSSGVPVCCQDKSDIRCPAGSSVFEYGGRPLACPAGSTKCPSGYSCLASSNPSYHLCCSTGNVPTFPQCLRGEAYVEPGTAQRRFCSPMSNNCPTGYHCMETDRPGQFICCTQGTLSDRFKGFCPPRQVPYVTRAGYPPTCHMQLNPCPTTAPYVCIYSPEKQDSFCCAPIDTAVRSFIPDNMSAMPGRNIETFSSYGNNNYNNNNKDNNPFAGMVETVPGGPRPQGPVGPISLGLPDPIPGVPSNKVLPPSLLNTPPPLGPMPPGFGQFGGNNFNGMNGMSGVGVVTRIDGNGNFNGFNGNNNFNNFNQKQNNFNGNFNQNGNMNQNFNGNGNFNNNFITGCPLGSKPLVRTDHSVVECAERPCPDGFACVFAEKETRFQCCSSSSIMLASKDQFSTGPPLDLNLEATTPGTAASSAAPTIVSSGIQCPPGFFLIDGKCLKVLFAGQKGCISDDQCSAREANATCDSGYCICPVDKPLVHGGKCVASCPEGFSNIAGRCYDPTTVIFMDSVDERANGTIGGYCLETLIEEKRCLVENAYCSEKTITCTCKAGYDLKMDFSNPDDKGSCQQLATSKFANAEPKHAPVFDDELYFIDIAPAKAIEISNSTADDDVDEKRFLFQADEIIPAFA